MHVHNHIHMYKTNTPGSVINIGISIKQRTAHVRKTYHLTKLENETLIFVSS